MRTCYRRTSPAHWLWLIILMALLPSGASAWMSKTAPPLPAPTGNVVNVSTVAELEYAVANLVSGTTIMVQPGTYNLTHSLLFNGVDSVAIRGATGKRGDVVLAGKGMTVESGKNTVPHVLMVWNVKDMLIADLTLTGAWYHNVHMAGTAGPLRPRMYNVHSLDCGEQHLKVNPGSNPTAYPDSGRVEFCRFEFTDRARWYYTNGVDVLDGAGWVVSDCEFLRIRSPASDPKMAGPAVLFWHNCMGTIVERCLFYECEFGIYLGLSNGPIVSKRDSTSQWDHQNGIIRNNVLYKARTGGDVGISVNKSKNFAIYNNTVIQNGTFAWNIEYRAENSNGVIFNNLCDGPIFQRNGATAELAGNITVAQNSWFVDADSMDFHLLPNCPAVDSAAVIEGLTNDFDGEARPWGAAADVGADEYQQPFERGDINRDSKINIFDVLEMLKAIGTGNDDTWLDLDSSGSVNIFDLLEMLKLL